MEEKFMEVFKLKYVHGLLLSKHKIMKEDIIESAMKYKARDGDVALVAFPKTGSSWLLYIIWEILHKGEPYHDMMETCMTYAPNIDITGPGPVEALAPPRFFKYHMPFQFINFNKNAKYIYIHRRPDDVLASYYHFSKFYTDHDFDFEFFFEAFLSGMTWYGDYFDHVLSAYAHKDDENFLMLSYEQLKKDTRNEILRIAEFLGEEYATSLREDKKLVDKIMSVTSFDHMKRTLSFDIPVNKEEKEPVDFFRKGEVGDGKNYLNPEQRERLRAKIIQKMKGTELLDAWLN